MQRQVVWLGRRKSWCSHGMNAVEAGLRVNQKATYHFADTVRQRVAMMSPSSIAQPLGSSIEPVEQLVHVGKRWMREERETSTVCLPFNVGLSSALTLSVGAGTLGASGRMWRNAAFAACS